MTRSPTCSSPTVASPPSEPHRRALPPSARSMRAGWSWPRAGRPVCADARAGRRGRAEAGDAGGAGRRRHRHRLPARHRSAARRAGAGARCCGSVRARLDGRQAVSARRADRGLEGRGAGRDRNELAEAGCVAFMQTGRLPHDNGVLLQMLRYAKTFDLPVWLRPVEDTLAGDGVAGAGAVAGRLGLPAVPALAETVALHTIFELQRETAAGCTCAACRAPPASNWCAAPSARAAGDRRRQRAPRAPGRRRHRLLRQPTSASTRRCARSATATRIVAGLADGTIDAICSDHSAGRRRRQAAAVRRGGARRHRPGDCCCRWCSNGAGRPACRLPRRWPRSRMRRRRSCASRPDGSSVGAKADVTVFDPQAPWTVERSALVSRSANTPFAGCELVGRAMLTLVGGEVRFDRKSGSDSSFG
jgi:dihydroorotase